MLQLFKLSWNNVRFIIEVFSFPNFTFYLRFICVMLTLVLRNVIKYKFLVSHVNIFISLFFKV